MTRGGRIPRQPRLDLEGALHHVMVRGLDGQAVFRDDRDREAFVGRLEALVPVTGVSVFAWVLMSNHAHFLVRTGHQPLSTVMRRLLTGYAVGFNRRHGRRGHLFQNRYKSVLVEEEAYFLELVRYIHLNPLRAGMLPDLDALDVHPWSGHGALLGGSARPWQNTDEVLGRFADTVGAARRRYREFVAVGVAQGHRDDLSGGGLLRSAEGHPELRRRGRGRERWAFDERVLGSKEFVERVWAEADRRDRETSQRRGDLDELIQRAATRFGLTPAELCSGARRRPIVAARRCVAWIGVCHWGLPPTSVARRLGVTRSTVLRAVDAPTREAEELLAEEQRTDA